MSSAKEVLKRHMDPKRILNDMTKRPGVLQFMGLQSRTGLSDWTELNWTDGQLTFHKGEKSLQGRKDSLFSKKYWKAGQSATCKLMKLEHSLTSYTIINSK